MRFARLRLMGAGALVLALSLVAACGDRTPTLLTVHATSTTRTSPDLAVVTLGVLARGATAREAQAAQATRMESIMAAVRAAGVEESEVQTVGYGLEPIYAYPRNAAPRITGYQSRNTISIRVRDLTAISALIDATVSDGANELQGIQFTYLDEEASLDTARAQAVERARQRADRYAEAAGMRVARVLSITEPGGVVPPVLMDGRRMDYAAVEVRANEQSAGAISPGALDNRSSVTVVFELR